MALNNAHLNSSSSETSPLGREGGSGKEGREGSGKHVAGSFKSVSFSATNQTLQADNTIRQSSTRMEIKPAAVVAGRMELVEPWREATWRTGGKKYVNTRAEVVLDILGHRFP